MTPTQKAADQSLASRVAAAMFERDSASRALQMVIEEVRPGFARVRMLVRADMVNGHRICHGGMVFSLADSAFAFACNSHNRVAVAAACSIDFVSPAREGDVLTAEAVEKTHDGRNGIYDVRVTNGDERTVAMFRGRSRAREEKIIDD
ncbi:MAG: hydroxyphenylacetyl-CoA thioesterase PaaI [Steroidobacteraceae bacterium]